MNRTPKTWHITFGRDHMRLDGYVLFIAYKWRPDITQLGEMVRCRYSLTVRMRSPMLVSKWRTFDALQFALSLRAALQFTFHRDPTI